jgi:Domain of unknown function (DUF4177)
MSRRYEYKVIELREGLMGGKMSAGKLQTALNEHSFQGWQLKEITTVEGKGKAGAPGAIEGVLVTFEREVS